MKVVLLVIFIVLQEIRGDGFDEQLKHIKTKTDPQAQADAVTGLINRIVPQHAAKFSIVVDTTIGPEFKDTFRIEKISDNETRITGTSGVAAASGFHHYLKYYCLCHISWEASQLNLPAILPDANVTVTSNDRFRYYQNVCTTSYTFVWWDWAQWEKHIDWMALNSFNFVLASNGQEAIWRKVYRQIGLTEAEIEEHFTGPAFFSWHRMGNLRGWGASLSEAWDLRSLILQNNILKRMREFGIITILPAFAGHVPVAFERIYPNASMVRLGPWAGFEDKYCCPYLIDPLDPLFNHTGTLFLTELINAFGTDHVYNCDTFNEMTPPSTDLIYLSNVGQAIYQAMTTADPNAIWIMQNWLFVHNFIFWTENRIKALVTSVPKGKMIVLDLQSEQFPQYQRLQSYFGQPYIWCMLHNFGGTLGMFGSSDVINEEIFNARNANGSTLIGTGLTPEGINQNYVIYDLMNEMAWQKSPYDLSDWFTRYATRRYGKVDANATQAWQILRASIYNFNDTSHLMRGRYVYNRRPSTRLPTYSWYNSSDLLSAWSLLLQAADNLNSSDCYQHDLVDVTRQMLQVSADEHYVQIISAFNNGNITEFQALAERFLDIINDAELILATNKAFLLGVWLNSAKASAASEEVYAYLLDAKFQITLWGPNGEIFDYANKQWSGMVSDFFLPRWSTFLTAMNDSLVNGTAFNETATISQIVQNVEYGFIYSNDTYPDQPVGNAVDVARYIHGKWSARRTTGQSSRSFGQSELDEYFQTPTVILKD